MAKGERQTNIAKLRLGPGRAGNLEGMLNVKF